MKENCSVYFSIIKDLFKYDRNYSNDDHNADDDNAAGDINRKQI